MIPADMSRASLEERQRFPRQPRATPTPSREPRPASAQISMGVMGVWRLDTANGEASAKPMLPPTNAARRSAPGSQRILEAIKTAAPMPTSPPMTAPANNPGFPAPLPSTDPTTAPSPASTQAAMNRGNVFKGLLTPASDSARPVGDSRCASRSAHPYTRRTTHRRARTHAGAAHGRP